MITSSKNKVTVLGRSIFYLILKTSVTLSLFSISFGSISISKPASGIELHLGFLYPSTSGKDDISKFECTAISFLCVIQK